MRPATGSSRYICNLPAFIRGLPIDGRSVIDLAGVCVEVFVERRAGDTIEIGAEWRGGQATPKEAEPALPLLSAARYFVEAPHGLLDNIFHLCPRAGERIALGCRTVLVGTAASSHLDSEVYLKLVAVFFWNQVRQMPLPRIDLQLRPVDGVMIAHDADVAAGP